MVTPIVLGLVMCGNLAAAFALPFIALQRSALPQRDPDG